MMCIESKSMKQKPICEYSLKKRKLCCAAQHLLLLGSVILQHTLRFTAMQFIYRCIIPIDLHKIVLTMAKKKKICPPVCTQSCRHVSDMHIHEMERLQGWERRYTVFFIFTFTNTAAAVKQDSAV